MNRTRKEKGKPKVIRGDAARKRNTRTLDPDDFIDYHIRFGLDDHWCRLPLDHFGKLVAEWILAGNDVVLRCSHKNYEANIILRGGTSAYTSSHLCDPQKNLPVYNCITVAEMRKKKLEEQGIE